MQNSLTLLILTTFIFFSGCSENEQSSSNVTVSSDGYVITGNIAGAATLPIYLEKLAFNQNIIIDTAIIANDGSFEMRGVVDERAVYMLRINQETSWILVLDNEEINFTGNKNHIFNYNVTGPQENKLLLSMVSEIGNAQTQMVDLSNQFQQIQMQGGPVEELLRLQQEYQNQTEFIGRYTKEFADTVSSDIVKVFAISMMDINEHYGFINDFINENKHLSNSNSLFRQIEQQLSTASPFAVGRQAPDFTLSTPQGNQISLSDTRGKIVYLDFWASWCGPCRRENPNLVRLYNEYNNKGFTIFGVSLDTDMARWVNAIRDDQLSWKWQGSELKGWGCSISRKYQVTAIPATFLLDENGVIIARNLRGIQLENKLKEIFAQTES